MGLFSFAEKTKQDTVSNDSEFYSHAEEEPTTPRRRSKRKQNQEGSDPVLPEKKRARRRLVGAVALVLAAVIGLPMILDSEPKPLTNDIAIEIPSKDKPAIQAPKPVVPAASLDKDEEFIEPPAKDTAPPAAPAPQESKAAPPVPAETRAAPAQATALPKRTEVSAAEERAHALLEGQPDPKAAKSKPAEDSKNGKLVIQIAALASQDKVNELQNKLKSAGIKSYTSKVATRSGERIRVRVGPFSSRDEAEKVRARLVKLGLGGTLIPV